MLVGPGSLVLLFLSALIRNAKKLLLAFKDSRKGKRERFPFAHYTPDRCRTLRVPLFCPQMSVHSAHQVLVTIQILAPLDFLAALFILFIYYFWGVGGWVVVVEGFGYKSMRSCWECAHVWRSERVAHVRGLLLVVWCVCVLLVLSSV